MFGIDDIKLPKSIRQVRRLAHVVDRLPDRPRRRHRNEFRLHAAAGGVFRVEQTARQRDPLVRRKLFQNFPLFVLRQILEDRDRIVGIDLAHAFGDRFGGELLKNFLADGVIDLGESREIEIVAHQGHQPRPQFRIEHLDQVTEIGLMQIADEFAQHRRIGSRNRLRDALDIIGADCAIFSSQAGERRLRGRCFFLEHAETCCQRAAPQR